MDFLIEYLGKKMLHVAEIDQKLEIIHQNRVEISQNEKEFDECLKNILVDGDLTCQNKEQIDFIIDQISINIHEIYKNIHEIYKNIEAINGHKIEIYVRGEGATPMTLDHIDIHTREFYRHEKEIDKSLKEIDINIGIIHGQVKDIYKDISRELDLL